GPGGPGPGRCAGAAGASGAFGLLVEPVQDALLFAARRAPFEQVRATLQRATKRRFQAPAADGLVVPAGENRRHRLAPELGGPGVLRVFEEAVGERFLLGRCGV